MREFPRASTDLVRIEVYPDVHLVLKPVDVEMRLLGRRAASEVYRQAALAEEAPDLELIETMASIAMVRRIARRGLVKWEGYEEAGEPVPFTPENIDELLGEWAVYDVLDREYVFPAMAKDAEKNASGSSRNGISTGGENTAARAAKSAPSAPTS